MELPPLGIVPKKLWDEERYHELCEAIKRYWDAELPIPKEWMLERNDLIGSLRKELK